MKHINKTKAIVLYLLCFISSLAVYGQGRRISGQVIDAEDNSELPGVNVRVKDTSTGTITDLNGNYSLEVPAGSNTLVFSFVGYASQEVEIGNRSTIDVSLASDAQQLQEIVVTGYSSEERRDVTGAVTTVSAEKLKAVPTGNVEQALQGRAAGVTVITNSQPGTTSVVRIRGFGAFGGNEPLYIVDGVPVESTNFLQPDDIESTTILKDAPSASIYGARAANGVIVYTTKRGKRGDGKVRVSYDGTYGVSVPGTVDNILNPQEQADWTWQAIRNTATQLGVEPAFEHPQYGTGQNPVLPDYLIVGGEFGVTGTVNLDEHRDLYNVDNRNGSIYQVVRANKEGTNWFDEITRPAPLHRHTLGFSGGGENNAFYISLGLQDQQGVLLHQGMKRYSLRANSSFDITDNFRVGQNFQATYYSVRGIVGGAGGRGAAGDENQFLSAFRMPAIIPVRDEFGGYAGTSAKGFNNPRNPVAERERSADNNGYSLMGFGNLYAELDVIEGLTLRSSFGGGYSNNYYNYYSRPSYENSENQNTFTYGEGAGTNFNWVFTNTASYEKNIAERHRLTLLAGTEALNTGFGRNMQGSGINPFSRDLDYITLTNTQPGASRVVNSNYGLGVNFFSVFGSAKYIFNDKYIINGVIRRDGSSRFGAETRYGVFPAASVAWRISEEGFMSGVAWLDDLKIRGGYGQMGNSNNVNPYNQFSLYASSLPRAAYDIGGTNSVAEGFYRSRIGNPNARWETSTTANIGVDGTFFNGKLSVVFDFWRKETEDLLYQLTVPSVIGALPESPSINIASMMNQGIDIEVTTRGNANALGWELTATGAFLQNEITSLAPGVDYFDARGSRIGNLIRNQVGNPISSYFGYEVEGLFQDAAEVAEAPTQEGAGVGRFRYRDINNDGVITADDRTYLGDPVPDFSGGLNLRLTYGNFDFETFMGAFLGFENYNFSKWYTDFYPSFTGAAIGSRVRESFTFENGGNTVPVYENVSNFSTNTASNSYYIEKGDYLRLMNLQIGYNIPAATMGRLGIERARIFLQGTNLFTITNYSGLDPGVGGAADTTLGVDIGNPPVTKGFNVGVSLGL